MSLLMECSIGHGKFALVVDDEPMVGQIMCRVLEQMGYQAEHALDGDEALAHTMRQQYDIVVCDLLMPRTNGMALYELWCEQAPGLVERTIFVTGDSLGTETVAFVRRTGCPCIYKPFKLNDLAQAIASLQSSLDDRALPVR